MTDDETRLPRRLPRRRPRLRPRPAPAAPSALPEDEFARLTDEIIAALKTVYDPEIPSDIYELGLIYKIDIADDRARGDRDDAHHAQLSLGAGTADHGGKRGGERPRRRRGQGQYRVGSALGPEPDVGRSPRRPQYVVRREARPRDRDQPLCR